MSKMLILFLFILTACAQAELTVQSLPAEAEVALIEADGKIRPLGKTPLKMEVDDVFKTRSAFSQLQISKEDHQTETILVSKSSMPVDYEISVNLKKQMQDLKGMESNSRSEKIAQQIAQANNLISNRRLMEAEQLMSKFVTDFPHVSVGYDYLGNINYLKKDLKRALYYYEKGLQLNPDNMETREMVNKLKGMFN